MENGDEWSSSRLDLFTIGAYRIEGWVGPRVSLDAWRRGKCLPSIKPWFLDRPALRRPTHA